MNATAINTAECLGDQAVFRCEHGPGNNIFSPLFSLWHERRGSRRWPERSDIHPRDMRAYLWSVQLFEVAGRGDFRIRVLGSEFVTYMGYDPSGQLVSQLRDDLVKERTLAALRIVAEMGDPLRTIATATLSTRVKFSSIEKIWLPLGPEHGVTHILSQVHRTSHPINPRQ